MHYCVPEPLYLSSSKKLLKSSISLSMNVSIFLAFSETFSVVAVLVWPKIAVRLDAPPPFQART